MIIRDLKEHFPARASEWLNAATISSWGIYVILHPDSFDEPVFAGFHHLVPTNAAGTWGLITLFMGLLQAAALVVNGAYRRTPMIRLAMSAASSLVWGSVIIGICLSGHGTPGLVLYTSAVAINLISAYRSSCDAVIADATWRATGAGKRGRTDRYAAVSRV